MLNCPHCRQELTPHEIGALYSSLGRTQHRMKSSFKGAKLTVENVDFIRSSKEPIKHLAEKFSVSIPTVWRVKKNMTYSGQIDLSCPHCEQKLTIEEIGKLFGALGGSTPSAKRVKAAIANGRKKSKLTEKEVEEIRKSNASTRELARKYNVLLSTIRNIRKNKAWKSDVSD